MRLTVAVLVMTLLQASKAPVPCCTVVDARTRAPLPHARVLLVKTDAPMTAVVVVDVDVTGQFSVEAVPAGTYRIIAEHDGHLRTLYPSPIAIAAGKSPDRLVIALVPTVVIAGRVFDEHGAPAPKVYVRAHRVTDGTVTTETVAESRTNDLGEYRLLSLAPGSYGISAEPYLAPHISTTTVVRTPGAAGNAIPRYIVPTPPCPDCMGEGQSMQSLSQLLTTGAFLDPLALTGQSYPRVYFPGTIELAHAKPMTAEAGARLDGVDLRLVLKERVVK